MPPASAAPSSASSAAPPSAPALPADVQELVTKTKQIADLIRGDLDLLVTPESLFDIDVRDERAVQVEVKRLQRLLGVRSDAADAGADAATGASPQKQKPTKKPAPKLRTSPQKKPAKAPKDQDETASADAGAPANDAAPPPSADPQLLSARLELDRARLDFLGLPVEQRKAILTKHAERVEEAKSKVSETAQKITATEQTRAQAEAAQRQALEQAA
ncbi:MAG: hypothetical protein AB7S68_20305, partial [Polyangiaceae bacterium]